MSQRTHPSRSDDDFLVCLASIAALESVSVVCHTGGKEVEDEWWRGKIYSMKERSSTEEDVCAVVFAHDIFIPLH